MKKEVKAVKLPSLAEVEQAVVAEYRELGRQELERRLQQLAHQAREFFPPLPPATPRPGPAHGTGVDPTQDGLRAGPGDAKMV